MEFGRIFTLALTALGVGVGWMNPVIGLMVYYAFAILRPTQLWFWSFGGTERLSLLVGVSTLVGWALKAFGDWSPLRVVFWPVFGLVLYLTMGALAAQFWAISPRVAWNYWENQFKIVIMVLVTITILREARDLRMFAWVITAGLGYLAYVFNSQYHFDGWNRIYPYGFGGIDNNGVAMIMVMGVPLCFFLAIHDKRLWVRGLCFFAALCLIHVVLFSFSRGGQLGLIMVGVALFTVAMFKLPNKGLTLALALVMLAITLRLAGPQVREDFASIFVNPEERDASAASRFDTWNAAWAAMKDNPLGLGPRNFNLVSARYGLQPNKSVHNLFLQTGADYGFIGMFGLMLFYFGTIWQVWRMTNSRTAIALGWPRYFGHMVVTSLAGFLVCSTFIGMETVEVGYIVATLGLCTVAYVHRMGSAVVAGEEGIAELAEVPPPGSLEDLPELTPAQAA
jgi:probable O-glycosylation ligase (exosortase A-associated)